MRGAQHVEDEEKVHKTLLRSKLVKSAPINGTSSTKITASVSVANPAMSPEDILID